MTRREALAAMFAASAGAAAVATGIGVLRHDETPPAVVALETIPDALVERITERLLGSVVGANFGSDRAKVADMVRRSIQASSAAEMQELVVDTYGALEEVRYDAHEKREIAIRAPGGARHPVLFLADLDMPGFAMALNDIGVIVVPRANLPADAGERKAWLAEKVAHEARHIDDLRADPSMAILETEANAYRVTAQALARMEPDNQDADRKSVV
mgnify:CR=1 FL=1